MTRPPGRRGRSWILVTAMLVAAHPVLMVTIASLGTVLALVGTRWVVGFVVVALLVGLLEWRREREQAGFTVRARDEPDLADLVESVAAGSGFTDPLVVRVVPGTEASTGVERIEGRLTPVMLLGLPYLRSLTAAELSALMAHELAHREDLSTRLGRATVYARADLSRAWQIPWVGARLLAIGRTPSMAAELEADEIAAAVVGAEAAASALLRTGAVDELFDTVVDWWAERLVDTGEYPADAYDAAAELLEDPAALTWLLGRAQQWDIDLDAPADTHPSRAQRIEHLLGPSAEAVLLPGEPVRLHQLGHISDWCSDAVFQPDVSDLRPGSVRQSPRGHFDFDPAAALSDLRRVTGEQDTRRAFERTLERLSSGASSELAHELDDDLDEAPAAVRATAERAVLVSCIGTALIVPLLHAGWGRGHRWLNHLLVDPSDGSLVDVSDTVDRACASRDTAALRRLVDAALDGTT